MGVTISLVAVIGLILLAWVGVGAIGARSLFGIIIPYAALATFVIGFIYRIIDWAKSPVPFRIPTTAGQMKSLSWIKPDPLDNPSTPGQVFWRMVLEILLFRSLFRNTRMEFHQGPKVAYASSKWLWLGAIAFHYSFLTTVLRHLRLFTEPTPYLIQLIDNLDGFLEVGLPPVMISGVVLLLAAGFLFGRRIVAPQVRYISLPADFFPLFLILAIAATGILMRYFWRVDVTGIKELAMSLVAFRPKVPAGVGSLFFIHLFLVAVLLAYFPFSKLMHLGGVFFSPTRNLANNSREIRHLNPWNYPVRFHTYAAYEDDFREKMIEAGLPVEKESDDQTEAPTLAPSK